MKKFDPSVFKEGQIYQKEISLHNHNRRKKVWIGVSLKEGSIGIGDHLSTQLGKGGDREELTYVLNLSNGRMWGLLTQMG